MKAWNVNGIPSLVDIRRYCISMELYAELDSLISMKAIKKGDLSSFIFLEFALLDVIEKYSKGFKGRYNGLRDNLSTKEFEEIRKVNLIRICDAHAEALYFVNPNKDLTAEEHAFYNGYQQ